MDTSLRPLEDNRNRNAVTRCDSYPTPLKNDCILLIEQGGPALHFERQQFLLTKKVEKTDRDKTALQSYHEL